MVWTAGFLALLLCQPGTVTSYVLTTGVVSGEDYEEVDRYNRQGRAGRASGRGAQQNRRGSWRYKRWEDLHTTNILLAPPPQGGSCQQAS